MGRIYKKLNPPYSPFSEGGNYYVIILTKKSRFRNGAIQARYTNLTNLLFYDKNIISTKSEETVEILLGLILLLVGGPIAGVLTYKKIQEIKKQTATELEKARYEPIERLLAEALATGEPLAVEALKPIADAVAEQLKSGEKEKEHQRKLEEINARNEPLRLWLKEIEKTWERVHDSYSIETTNIKNFQRALAVVRDATEAQFPNLQLPEPDTKQLPNKTED